MAWQLIQLDSCDATAKCLSTLNERKSDMETMDPQQDPNWFLDGKECDPALYLFLYQDEYGNEGACLLRKHYRPVNVTLGEFIIYRHPVERFELWSSPVLKAKSAAESKRMLSEFLSCLDQILKPNEALSIEGLPTDSLLFKCLSVPNSKRLCLQLGKPFMHQSINFPDSYDEYLKQMSKRSRKSVQYSRRKLDKEFETELFECDAPELIERFLTDAIAVSKKTYQWNLLGLGLRDKDDFKESLKHWARHANLQCYLLYCDATPTAFMLGYTYKSRYYYIDVGYDPDWAKYSVGSVLQLLVIERLYEMNAPPTSFDFSTGYGEHKGRFGNREQEEINILVLPVNMRNRLFLFFYNLVDAASTGLVAFFDRLGIKKQLKKTIRRFSRSQA